MRPNRTTLSVLAAVALVFAGFFAFQATVKSPDRATLEATQTAPAAGESESAAPAQSEKMVAPATETGEAAAPVSEEATAPAAEDDEEPATDDEAATPPAPTPSVNINVEAALEERIMGSATAPLTLIEYASMTCPHCADFNTNTMPRLKKDFVETGKVKLVYRDLPTDAIATKAAMMARCAPVDQYFNIVETIYSTQQRWIQGPDITANLSRIGVLAGMDQPTINACIENEDLRKGLLRRVEFAQSKWYFTSTPSFVLQSGNYEETFKGSLPYEEVAAKLNKLLSK